MRNLRGYTLLITALLACDSKTASVATATRQLGPFRQLEQAHLGMAASDFANAYPRARIEPYAGYADSLDGFGVVMHFTEPGFNSRQVPRGTLESVVAMQTFVSDSAAAGAWQTWYHRARANMGTPVKCGIIHVEHSGAGRLAEWNTSGGPRLSLSYSPEATVASLRGRGGLVPRLLLRLAPAANIEQAAAAVRVSAAPCP